MRIVAGAALIALIGMILLEERVVKRMIALPQPPKAVCVLLTISQTHPDGSKVWNGYLMATVMRSGRKKIDEVRAGNNQIDRSPTARPAHQRRKFHSEVFGIRYYCDNRRAAVK